MKNILTGIALIISLSGISQTKPKQDYSVSRDTITRVKLSQVKLLSDPVMDIPTSYSAISFDITYKVAGVIKAVHGNSVELSSFLIKDLAKTNKVSKIFLDLKILDQKKSISKTYVFYLID